MAKKKISKKEKDELYSDLMIKALEYSDAGKHKEAISLLEEAHKLRPDDEVPLSNIGFSYFSLGNILKCEEYLKKAYAINPNNKITCMNMAFCLRKQNKQKESVKYFKKGIDRYLDTINVMHAFGETFYALKKYNEAAKYLQKSVDEGMEDTDIHIILIKCLLKMEKFDDVINVIDKIKMTDKNFDKLKEFYALALDGKKYTEKITIKNKKTVESLCEFIEIINKINEENKDCTLVFRGQRNKYYSLVPSIFRNKNFEDNEQNIIQDFNLKAQAYFEQEMEHFDNVDKIALMQHHGIPTRLLDFSESPLIALYFALENITKNSYGAAPCVYALNLRAFRTNKDGCILPTKKVASKQEDEIFKYKKDNCVFSPKLKNKRLTAQKGVFALINSNEPLENSVDEKYLTKIEISTDKVLSIKNELHNLGITPSFIYPDFMGLSDEIKNPRKFAQEEEAKETLTIDYLGDWYKKVLLMENAHNIGFNPKTEKNPKDKD